MFVSQKIWRSLFSFYLPFMIRPFALLPTIFECLLLILRANEISQLLLSLWLVSSEFIHSLF